jgi:hypothetical protein
MAGQRRERRRFSRGAVRDCCPARARERQLFRDAYKAAEFVSRD